MYIFPLPLEPPSHVPPHSTPLGWYRAPVWVFPEPYSKFPLSIYFTYHAALSIHLTLSSHGEFLRTGWNDVYERDYERKRNINIGVELVTVNWWEFKCFFCHWRWREWMTQRVNLDVEFKLRFQHIKPKGTITFQLERQEAVLMEWDYGTRHGIGKWQQL